ncbi:MAG: hypothetical protein IPM21_13445 [Acidobacteria bacterium]|nr:hypothetical protein [Acidobacteriota bacterium]
MRKEHGTFLNFVRGRLTLSLAVNLPNYLTLGRILFVPLLVVALLTPMAERVARH